MNSKFMKKSRGAIAVFLSLIMLGMTVFECMLIDTSRVIAAKTVASGAGELALNSALANYDQVLYEVYGLFATATDEADLEKKVTEYFNRTLRGAGIDGNMEDLHNMLNLLAKEGSLELTNAPGSDLANTDVLKQQILEYMKFRGPVNIGLGLLEKINSLKDFNKQADAMEAQMDYEKELDTVQKACQEVYDKANDLKTWDAYDPLYNKGMIAGCLLESWDDIHKRMQEFEKNLAGYAHVEGMGKNFWYAGGPVKDITEADNDLLQKILGWKADMKPEGGSYPVDVLEKTIQYLNNPSSLPLMSLPELSQHYADSYLVLREDYDKIMKAKEEGNLDNLRNAMKTYYQDIAGKEGGSYMDSLQEFHALLNAYISYRDTVNPDDNHLIGDVNKYKQEFEKMSIAKCWPEAADYYKQQVEDQYSNIYTELMSKRSIAQQGQEKARGLKQAICCDSHGLITRHFGKCCLEKAVEKVEEERDAWKGKIDALPQGSAKDSMQQSFENEATGINKEEYQHLYGIANSTEKFCKDMITYINLYTIADGSGNPKVIADTSAPNWTKLLNQITSSDTYKEAASYDCINDTNPGLPMPSSPFPGEIAVTVAIDNDKFYQFLSQICSKREESTDGNKEEAKGKRNTLFDKGNEDGNTSAADRELGSIGGEEWNRFANSNPNDADNTKVKKEDNNKKAADNAKGSLDHTKSLLGNIGSLLLDARNNLYITEYAVGMFSCYTTAVEDGKEAAQPVYTIAGKDDAYHKLCKENNVLYRSEQEYILWGNQDQKKNVDATLMSIFGIRFALNLLYAFTGDAEINAATLGWATAIAGWTGFGVPIVQTVLKVALALAETTYDVAELKKGNDVVLYKTSSTWIMKPSNIGKEAITIAAEEAQKVTANTLETAFEYIGGIAEDNIDKVTKSVENTVKKAEDYAVDTAVSAILSPFQTRLVSLSTSVNLTADTINAEIDKVYQSVYAQAQANGTVVGQLECFLLDHYGGSIKEAFINKVNELKGASDKVLSEQAFEELTKTLKEKARASTLVTELGNNVKQEVREQLDHLSEETQEAVGNAVSEQVTGLLEKVQGTDLQSRESVTSGFAMTLNYQEYVHIFLLIKSCQNDEQFLIRVSNLIQLNMRKRREGFEMKNAYTMLELNADVKVQTNFLGRLDSFLENPVGGKTEYVLQYHGLQGY